MYCYDRARLLAADIKESKEFIEYKALKDEVYADDATKGMIKQFKKLQFQYQTQVMSGQTPSPELTEQVNRMGEMLGFNQKAAQYISAEYRLQVMINDIYKIIGDACELDLDIF